MRGDTQGRAEPSWLEPDVVGSSRAIKLVLEAVDDLAKVDDAVLFVGETGVGKEVFARRLHAVSPRRAGPFAVVHVGALTESLWDAELFGVAERAATGVGARPGALGSAAGGTLLLDEIGEAPCPFQVRLLRPLDGYGYTPVGSSRVEPFEGRVVSATHRDLDALCAAGRFREDLYYRITQEVVEVPPLRVRPEDIVLLAEALARRAGADLCLAPDGLRALVDYPWPGNVRQLRNVVLRLRRIGGPLGRGDVEQAIARARRVDRGHSTPRCTAPAVAGVSTIDERLWEVVASALEAHHGNTAATADALGTSRKRLATICKNLEIAFGIKLPLARGRFFRRQFDACA